MEQACASQQAGEDRQREGRKQPAEAGAERERDREQQPSDHERRAGRARAVRVVGGQSAGPVTDGHAADRAAEEVREPERRRQAARPDARGPLAEVAPRRVGGGEARVGERERELRQDEHGERRPEGGRIGGGKRGR